MTATIESFSGPNYISSRSADVILSDVRPIKLKLDALRSINVLLDEFLYNLLNAAKSITTDKLKTNLIKILPTTLGKDAILEAELELKAYWERTTSPSARNAGDSSHDFDLTWSFELLRLKCEAYTTMNDVDEDTDAERRLNDRMANNGGGIPPQQLLLPPAALYLTAILEHICEHILSSVSRVTSRDSSRTVATVQDLFVALCEDDTMYIYEQIENLSKAIPIRRSKSISRNNNGSPGASRTASPAIDLRDSAPTPARMRMSSDSISNMAAVNGSSTMLPRNSTEKSRVAKIMSRSSSDNSDRFESGANEVKSLNSNSQNGNSVEFVEDVALQEEFDELMRSGATMKVSLTPDRLKSMDVSHSPCSLLSSESRRLHKQERKRSPQNGGSSASRNGKQGHTARKPSVRNVDAIAEDDESHSSSPPPSAFQQNAFRARQGSISRSNSKSTSSALSGNPRARSISVSAVPLLRSKSDMPPPPLPSDMPAPLKIQKSVSASGRMMDNGRPQRVRKVGRNRESIDLDDIMNGSDDELADLPPAASPTPSTPRRAHISKAAQELVDFLDEGPPVQPLTSVANPSMMSLESTKGKTNRFQRMVSRLAISASRENLNGRGTTVEPPRTPKTPRSMRSPYGSSISSPPPSFNSHSLNSKRSMPNVVIATPPPPPGTYKTDHTPPRTVTPTPSSHASTEDIILSPGGVTPTRRSSVARKAVPVFDGGAISQFPLPPTRVEDIKKASQIKPNGTNGSIKHSSDEESASIRHRKESSHRVESTQSTVSDHKSERSENGSNHSLVPSPEVLHNPPTRSSSKRLPHRSPRAEPSVPDALQEQPEEQATEESKDEVKETAKEETLTEPSISLSSEDVFCLRKLLGVATTAEECRLLVEMFLTKNGAAKLSDPDFTPRVARFSRHPDEALKELILLNQSLELSLVGVLLGDDEEERMEEAECSVPPPAEPIPFPTSSE
ncbi:hypothetical protein QCA50_000800 [Cerrena zonata]|uniref:Uncharacterized protein n=1 Tax=Cerrena zonata TaxID=2478898 RepID=A0AAW0GVM0_9APHY